MNASFPSSLVARTIKRSPAPTWSLFAPCSSGTACMSTASAFTPEAGTTPQPSEPKPSSSWSQHPGNGGYHWLGSRLPGGRGTSPDEGDPSGAAVPSAIGQSRVRVAAVELHGRVALPVGLDSQAPQDQAPVVGEGRLDLGLGQTRCVRVDDIVLIDVQQGGAPDHDIVGILGGPGGGALGVEAVEDDVAIIIDVERARDPVEVTVSRCPAARGRAAPGRGCPPQAGLPSQRGPCA